MSRRKRKARRPAGAGSTPAGAASGAAGCPVPPRSVACGCSPGVLTLELAWVAGSFLRPRGVAPRRQRPSLRRRRTGRRLRAGKRDRLSRRAVLPGPARRRRLPGARPNLHASRLHRAVEPRDRPLRLPLSRLVVRHRRRGAVSTGTAPPRPVPGPHRERTWSRSTSDGACDGRRSSRPRWSGREPHAPRDTAGRDPALPPVGDRRADRPRHDRRRDPAVAFSGRRDPARRPSSRMPSRRSSAATPARTATRPSTTAGADRITIWPWPRPATKRCWGTSTTPCSTTAA